MQHSFSLMEEWHSIFDSCKMVFNYKMEMYCREHYYSVFKSSIKYIKTEVLWLTSRGKFFNAVITLA